MYTDVSSLTLDMSQGLSHFVIVVHAMVAVGWARACIARWSQVCGQTNMTRSVAHAAPRHAIAEFEVILGFASLTVQCTRSAAGGSLAAVTASDDA